MEILDLIASSMNGWPLWVQGLVGLVFLAKIVTTITPTKIDDKYFGKATVFVNGLLKVLNVQALNVGKDKNADEGK